MTGAHRRVPAVHFTVSRECGAAIRTMSSPLSLDLDDLADKVVTRRRGGFCYELNGLFSALLRELGFSVTMLSAEVARAAGGFSPAFDHLALRVDLAEPWLADVGFGEGFRLPVNLNDTGDQLEDGLLYRITTDSEYRVLWRRDTGDWIRQYKQIAPIIPHTGVSRTYSLSALILSNGVLFFCDTHLNMDPTAEQVAEMTILASRAVRRFGLKPKAALLSHSTFGASVARTLKRFSISRTLKKRSSTATYDSI